MSKMKVYLEFNFINFILMEIAAIENPRRNSYRHNWVQILYMITSAICFVNEVYQRISIDVFYASC